MSSTSLACKRELEVDFYFILTPSPPPPPPSHARASRRCISTLFPCPSPPSHAKVSRRWIRIAFRRRSHVLHLPCMEKRVGGGFMSPFNAVRTSSNSHARAGGGFSYISMPFARPPPPSHAKASWRWIYAIDCLVSILHLINRLQPVTNWL